MNRWRPQPRITVKAIGLLWREGKLLAAEVRDDRGQLTGVRPPGGSVEFGETAEQAVRREFAEELGLDVTPQGPPIVLENIFSHEGAPGHEIVFVFSLSCAEEFLPSQQSLEFIEDGGATCVAGWYDPAALDRPGRPQLLPAGLKAALDGPAPK